MGLSLSLEVCPCLQELTTQLVWLKLPHCGGTPCSASLRFVPERIWQNPAFGLPTFFLLL